MRFCAPRKNNRTATPHCLPRIASSTPTPPRAAVCLLEALAHFCSCPDAVGRRVGPVPSFSNRWHVCSCHPTSGSPRLEKAPALLPSASGRIVGERARGLTSAPLLRPNVLTPRRLGCVSRLIVHLPEPRPRTAVGRLHVPCVPHSHHTLPAPLPLLSNTNQPNRFGFTRERSCPPIPLHKPKTLSAFMLV